jgi:hypothetical protein
LRRTLETALEEPGPIQLSFDELGQEDRQQLERDRQAWKARLEGLDGERERELAAISRRYARVRTLVFLFAVTVCVPGRANR